MSLEKSKRIIEDEPSYEIYANLIGKDHSKIVFNNTDKCTNDTNNNDTGAMMGTVASTGSQIIPTEEMHQEKRFSSDVATTNSSNHSHHSFVNLYERAINSIQTSPLSQMSLDNKNKGFQILSRMGFNEKDGGLGKKRQGKISPIKAVMKMDKKGLGCRPRSRSEEVKVTHYSPNNKKSPESSITIEKRYINCQRKRKLKDELHDEQKVRDKKARLLINSDLSDEFLHFL